MLAVLMFLSAADPTPSTPTATPKPLMSQTAWIVLCVLIIVFGLIAQSVGLGIFPLALLLFFLLLTAATERVTYIARRQQSAQRQL